MTLDVTREQGQHDKNNVEVRASILVPSWVSTMANILAKTLENNIIADRDKNDYHIKDDLYCGVKLDIQILI